MNPTQGNIDTILDRITDAVLVLDNNWCISYCNKAAAQFFHKPTGLLSGQHITTIWPDYKSQPLYKTCQQALKDLHPISLEENDGQRWWEKMIYPSPEGLTIFFRDITDRKKAEQQLEKGEKRYRALIDHNDGIISLVDEKMNVIFRNSAVAKVVGWTNEEYATINGMDNIHPDDAQHINNTLETALLQSGKAIPVLFRVKHKSGNYNWLEGVITNKADDPDIKGILTNLRDVTNRIEAEQKLQAEKELSDKIINSLPGIFYMADTTPKLLRWNKAFETISGYTAEELAGIIPIELFDTRDHPAFKASMAKALTEGTAQTEARLISKEGISTPFYFTGVRIEYNGHPVMLGTGIDITEQKKAAEELRKSSERFALSAKATSDMIWDWNLLTNGIWWNDNYIQLFGYKGDEPELQQISTWMNSIHPDDKERVVAGIYKVINSGNKYWTDEYRYVKKDGAVLFIHDRGYVSHDEAGKPYRMIGSMQNITQRIKAEQAIKESEEKYRSLVEQASDAIYIADTGGRLLTVNSSACKLTHYSEEEILKMNIYDFVFAEDIQKSPFRFDEIKQGKTVVIERIFKGKGGLVVNVECTAKMLSDGRILVFARDIAERIKARNEIIKEKNLSDSIINSLPGIFYLYDENGKFLRWNKNFETISGYNAAEISTMHPLDFFDAPEKELLRQKVEEVFIHGMADVEAQFFTKDKKHIPFYFNGWKLQYQDQPCLIGVGIDITEKREAEKKLLQSYNDIRRLASHLTQVREEERKRIGREIHDELGQQLTAVKMDVAWIDKKIAENDKAIKSKLKNIINLLDGSNKSVRRIITELSPGIIDNHGLLEALERQNVQFAATTGIPVTFTTEEKTINLSQPIANCIFRVYQESLTNIMRYAAAAKVVTSLSIVNGTVVVTIEDDGRGFDTVTMKSKTSFGLLGMKERVLSHGGIFHIHSQKGYGTKITVTVPYRQ
jgi:PAS domain S-box-containing protein